MLGRRGAANKMMCRGESATVVEDKKGGNEKKLSRKKRFDAICAELYQKSLARNDATCPLGSSSTGSTRNESQCTLH